MPPKYASTRDNVWIIWREHCRKCSRQYGGRPSDDHCRFHCPYGVELHRMDSENGLHHS